MNMYQRATLRETMQNKRSALAGRRGRRNLVISLIVTAAAVLLLFGVFLGLAVVRGNSMMPSVKHGDKILFARRGSPVIGDVVLLHSQQEDFIKRVVALPGDVVDISRNRLTVNGMPQMMYCAIGDTQPQTHDINFPLTLGADEYFVLGDNRENSRDSRTYGPVKAGQIRGRVILVLSNNIYQKAGTTPW